MRRLLSSVSVSVVALAAVAVMPAAQAADTSPTCTVSGPAFKNPTGSGFSYRATSLQTYQHRTWVGFAYDGGANYAVISWRSGAAHVLDTFNYQIPTEPSNAYTVNAVGVTPAGAVVAGVESRTYASRTAAFAWLHGHRYRLRTPRGWYSDNVSAVTDAGTIIGYGYYRGPGDRPRIQLASWSSPTARPKILRTFHIPVTAPVADNNGDISWSHDDATGYVRLASGQVRRLVDSDGYDDVYITSGAGHFMVASSSYRGVRRWDLAHVPATGPIVSKNVTATSGGSPIVGRTGAVVFEAGRGNTHRLKIDGKQAAALPALPNRWNVGISPQNGVAYTAKDRLVHFFRCH